MTQFLNLVLSGLVTGAIYSITASGLILTYTTSGIFNFAHGAIAFATAYLYYQLHTGVGLPIVPTVIICVFVFAPLLGLFLDRILLRRLAKAPVYARVVGTIGLLVMLPNLVQWLVISVFIDTFHWDLPGNEATLNGIPVAGIGPTPAHFYHPVSGVALDSNQIAVFIVAAVAALVLWFVLRRTRLGLDMRAVVDRETLAGLRGIDARRTSASAWVMTMILAGLGGVLIAPLFTLTDYIFTLVVLGSLSVVVLGGLRSIPIAFIGGLALGVVQNLVAGYNDKVLPDWLSTLSGLKSSVPFILVVLLLLVFGRDKSRRGGTMSDERPRPDHRAGMSKMRKRLPWAIWTLILIAYSLQWFNISWLRADTYGQTVIAQGLAVAVIFLSFVVVTGMGGMVSLAQGTFVTIGGFGTGWVLSHDWGFDIPGVINNGHVSFVWAMLIGAAIAGFFGMLIALPITKLGGISLALGTLAVAFVAALVILPIDSIRHTEAGWTIPSPTLDVPGLNQLINAVVVGKQTIVDTGQLPVQILFFLAVFGLLTMAIHALQRSASGRAILAVRSSEVAAAASGIRVDRTKVMMFGLASAIAGIGGVLLGVFSFKITDASAPPLIGLFWLALAVTFGVRRPGGALIAGLVFAGSGALFKWLGELLPGDTVTKLTTSVYFIPILSGLGAIQLAQEPDGILALAGQKKLEKERAKQAKLSKQTDQAVPADSSSVKPAVVAAVVPAVVPAVVAEAPAPGSALTLRDIVAGYGDVEVIHHVDLRVAPGTVTALLGANGAGKSTLCAVAAGVVAPTSGSVWMGETDITTQLSFRRARSGILYVPEARGIFPGLTVNENLEAMLRDPGHRELAYERFPILRQRGNRAAGLLSGGEQQMLSLAPALACPPTVLIADEPTLGLAPLLAEMVLDAIAEIRAHGTAVLLVEEHARNALRLADVVAFMELGRIVWIGPRAEADMDLLARAYLGGNHDASGDRARDDGPDESWGELEDAVECPPV